MHVMSPTCFPHCSSGRGSSFSFGKENTEQPCIYLHIHFHKHKKISNVGIPTDNRKLPETKNVTSNEIKSNNLWIVNPTFYLIEFSLNGRVNSVNSWNLINH